MTDTPDSTSHGNRIPDIYLQRFWPPADRDRQHDAMPEGLAAFLAHMVPPPPPSNNSN